MIIKELEHMEKIVASNKTLGWDGWTVVNQYPSEKGRTSKNGVLVDSKWYLQQRFEPGSNGWDIPQKFAV
jgi:hypothetical protein